MQKKLLVVDRADGSRLSDLFQAAGYVVSLAADPQSAQRIFKAGPQCWPDLLLLAKRADFDGAQILHFLEDHFPLALEKIPVILFSPMQETCGSAGPTVLSGEQDVHGLEKVMPPKLGHIFVTNGAHGI